MGGFRVPFWAWLSSLSLDAPLIALVWQDFVSKVYETALYPGERAALGLTVWAVYLADRLLDVRRKPELADSVAHIFVSAHRFPARYLLALVVFLDGVVAGIWISHEVLSAGLWVGSFVGTYLIVFSVLQVGSRWKAVAASALFSVGAFLISWVRLGGGGVVLVGPVVGLGALCLMNMTLPGTRAWRGWSGAGVSIVLLAGSLWLGRPAWDLGFVLSAGGLFWLGGRRGRWSLDALREWRDIALLGPVFVRAVLPLIAP